MSKPRMWLDKDHGGRNEYQRASDAGLSTADWEAHVRERADPRWLREALDAILGDELVDCTCGKRVLLANWANHRVSRLRSGQKRHRAIVTDFPRAEVVAQLRAALATQPASAPLDVERLARAIEHQKSHTCDDRFLECAAAIAAVYAERVQPNPLVTYTDPAGGPDWEPREDEA